MLLANHIAFSGFFGLLQNLMPSTARFVSLRLSLNDAKGVKIEGSGFAKSLNALAATSAVFETDGRIKDAVFSNIVVSAKDNSVSFALTAALDPKIIAFSPSSSVESTPIVPASGLPAGSELPRVPSDVPTREESSSVTPPL